MKALPPPAGFEGELRPYQVRGYSWIVKNCELGLGCLLADDMGLGKTVQLIAAVRALKNRGFFNEGRCMVVAPASLLINWQREFERFAPELTVEIFHGTERRLKNGTDRPDVLITSYGVLRRDLNALAGQDYRLMVLDEAQAIKNAKTAQAQAVKDFQAPVVVALTGTPVENRLFEYWSILSTVQPGLLGTAKDFQLEFADRIEKNRDMEAIERFKAVTAPFMLRRVKTDPKILEELPERNIVDHFTTLNARQAALYEDCLKTNFTDLEALEAKAEALEDEDLKKELNNVRLARRGAILRMITHLKQITNSPSQFMKASAEKPDSGKAEALLEIVERCIEADRKVLIFTQFKEMGERLQQWIERAFKLKADFLHGGLSLNERTRMVDRFQNDPEAKVFILSLKAGGTGLNLTAASAVIHYDLWWNPAVEDQASDRAWRIGQRRDVVVYRLITAGTFEEKVNAMLTKKRELADLTVSVGENWIGDLSDDEIKSIFALDRKRRG